MLAKECSEEKIKYFDVVTIGVTHLELLIQKLAQQPFQMASGVPIIREFKLSDNHTGLMNFKRISFQKALVRDRYNIQTKPMACVFCFSITRPNFIENIQAIHDRYTKVNDMSLYLVCEPCNTASYHSEITQAQILAQELNAHFFFFNEVEENAVFLHLQQLANRIYRQRGCFGWQNKTAEEINQAIISGLKDYKQGHRLKQVAHCVLNLGKHPKSDQQHDTSLFGLYNLLINDKKIGLKSKSYCILANLFNLQAASDNEADEIVQTLKQLMSASKIGQWNKLRWLFFTPELPKELVHSIGKTYVELDSIEPNKAP